MADIKANHQISLLRGATEYFDMLVADIDSSAFEVRLESYIFSVQDSAEAVVRALVRAAHRGVTVYLVVDGVGTPALPEPWPQQLDAAGVQWRIYRPLGRWGLLVPSRWRRLHRKLCVVDGLVAFCGGINVLDDMFDLHHGALSAPRFDFAVRVTGSLVQEVHAAMAQFWWQLQAVQSARQTHLPDAWQALQRAVQEMRAGSALANRPGDARARLVLRDNLRNRTRIERAYRLALGAARQDIILSNAYFLPGRKILKSLTHAAQRGVRVRLLLQGRYENFMQYYATRALYGKLLAADVEVYEYRASFLHAKVAVVDSHWATVGSSNMDPLSLLLAREANVVIEDTTFAQSLQLQLQQAMDKDAHRLNLQQHAQRGLWQKFLDHAALLLMRAMLFVSGKRY
jgi:cardiolipin synthase